MKLIDAAPNFIKNLFGGQIMSLGEQWPDLLTVREVAKILRVSPLTIKRWGKRGKLPAIRINSRGDRRYKKEAVLWLLGIQQKGV